MCHSDPDRGGLEFGDVWWDHGLWRPLFSRDVSLYLLHHPLHLWKLYPLMLMLPQPCYPTRPLAQCHMCAPRPWLGLCVVAAHPQASWARPFLEGNVSWPRTTSVMVWVWVHAAAGTQDSEPHTPELTHTSGSSSLEGVLWSWREWGRQGP